MVDTNRRYMKPREAILFGVANGGQGMGLTVINNYLPYFFVNIFNIDSRAVTLMLALEGVWDTVNDLLMGAVIDKTRTRYGKLIPYLKIAPLPSALTNLAIYAGPLLIGSASSTSMAKISYAFITYLLWEFFYTVGDVSFWGLSAAISPNPKDRSRTITTSRFLSGIVGGGPITIIMPILIDLVKNGAINTSMKKAFFTISIFTSVLGMGLFSLPGLFLKERVVQNSDEPSFMDCLKCVYANKPLRMMVFKDLFGSIGSYAGIYQNYYFIDVLGSASSFLVTGIPEVITGFISFTMIPFMKKRFNNRQIAIGAKVYQIIIMVLKYVFGRSNYKSMKFMLPLLMAANGLNGLAGGFNSVIPTEMIGETVDYSEWTTGQRTEGMSFAVLTFVGKVNNVMSKALGTAFLKPIGYQTSNESAIMPQTESTKKKIFALYTILPGLMSIGYIIPLFFYDLVGEKSRRMYAELEKIREDRLKKEVAGDRSQESGI